MIQLNGSAYVIFHGHVYSSLFKAPCGLWRTGSYRDVIATDFSELSLDPPWRGRWYIFWRASVTFRQQQGLSEADQQDFTYWLLKNAYVYTYIYVCIYIWFYIFIFREGGREGERDGEKHLCERETLVGCLSFLPWPPGIKPAVQACALTRNLNQQPIALQDIAQPTETHPSGQHARIIRCFVYPGTGYSWTSLTCSFIFSRVLFV